MALPQISMICRSVKSASCALIHGKQLVLDAAKNQRVQPGTEIHLASEDGREFLAITEVLKADVFQHARLKFRQHVHIAALRIEIVDVDAYRAALLAKRFKFSRPGAKLMPWGSRDMTIADPFGNRLTFTSPG